MPLIRLLCATVLVASSAVACRDGGSSSGPSSGGTNGGTNGGGDGGGGGGGNGGGPTTPGWTVLAREDFESGALPSATFAPDPVPDDGPFSDGGAFFDGVTPPAAFRASQQFGAGRLANGGVLLTPGRRDPRRARGRGRGSRRRRQPRAAPTLARAYRRHGGAAHRAAPGALPHLAARGLRGVRRRQGRPERLRRGERDRGALVAAGGRHHARTASTGSPSSTPSRGRTTTPGSTTTARSWSTRTTITLRGWRSGTGARSWLRASTRSWSSRSTARRRPTRRPASRSCPARTAPWQAVRRDPGRGRLPAPDLVPRDARARAERDERRPELHHRDLRPVRGSRPDEDRTYRAAIDASAACVWHYPVDAAEAAGAQACTNAASFYGAPLWPAGGSWPEWFMFGDPHVNYYEGEVFYDDVVLEVWRD